MTNYYDIIIVGSGISGLYAAYNILRLSPHTRILILESNKKPYIGGRTGNEIFYDTSVVVGAGVGRKDTDKLLQKLLNELHIDYKFFKTNMNYSKLIHKPINIKTCLKFLREKYQQKYKQKPSTTFRQFAKHELGNELYDSFIVSSGYSDYENQDTYEVLYHYQMEDNAPGWTGIHLSWNELVHKLCDKIGNKHIKTSNKVVDIQKLQVHPCLFKVTTEKGAVYVCNKIIIATRINTTQKLLSNHNIYQEIKGQEFLYVYAKFTKTSAQIMHEYVPSYTIVPGPLQKMIPMDPKKGVYMIAYADNENATFLKDHIDNTPKNRSFFEREVETALGIPQNTLQIMAIKDYYWPIGTHYYTPLNKHLFSSRETFIEMAQHPEPGILVIGEAVSRRQGWVEGALQSVHNVLNKNWIKNINC